MKQIFRCLLIVALWILSATTSAHAAELELISALPVNGPKNFQPSGLTLVRGKLYAVCDKHSTALYRIEIGSAAAEAVAHCRFRAPTAAAKSMDWEGLSSDPDGNFYLASESNARVLQLSFNGKRAEWVTPSLKPHGTNAGLLRIPNAGLEGIAWAGPGHLYAAAERHRRGIFELQLGAKPNVQAWACPDTDLSMPFWRFADFADLVYENGSLYALARNAEAIVALQPPDWREPGRTATDKIWSYASTIERPEYRYSSALFGNMEGFCMDREKIYLITDNNNSPRESNLSDRRPLLFIFKRP